jgi:hypothetical protein
LSYYEIYDNDPTEHNSDDSKHFYVAQGKLDYKNLSILTALSSSFYEKYYTENAPLTLRTEKKYVRDCEDDIIYIIASRADYLLNIGFHLIGESHGGLTHYIQETFNIANEDRGKIFEIPIGWNNYIVGKISFEAWRDSVFSYDINLYYNTGSTYELMFNSENILRNNTDEYNAVIFKNTLGVYEKIYFYGIRSDETSYDRTMSYYDENDILISSSMKKSFTLNTGWISEGEYQNMLLLLNSKDTYIEEDELNIPVVVIQSKTDKRSSRNKLYSLEVEFQYAFTDNL